MKIATPVNLIKKISLGMVLSSALYAAPNIPASCTTPGSCPDLTPALKNATVKEGVKFADADASHTVTIKAAATTTENVVITLPPVNGQPNQILATDASGHLVWKNEPSSADRLLGMIGFMLPNNAKGIYEINGQTVTDAKLAAYITVNPITGFSVSGNDVTLPNWKGRYLGSNGGFGIDTTKGGLLNDATAKNGLYMQSAGNHRHRISISYNSGTDNYPHESGSSWNTTNYTDYAGNHAHSLIGDPYTRPQTVSMPMVIIGESK